MNLKIIENRSFDKQGEEFDLSNWNGYEYGYYIVERVENEKKGSIIVFYGIDPYYDNDTNINNFFCIPLIKEYIDLMEPVKIVENIEREFTVKEIIKAISIAQELKTSLDQLNKSK